VKVLAGTNGVRVHPEGIANDSKQRVPARMWTLAGGAGDPYNADVEVGRDFALFDSEADLAFLAGTFGYVQKVI
jgi:hypothetical protein